MMNNDYAKFNSENCAVAILARTTFLRISVCAARLSACKGEN